MSHNALFEKFAWVLALTVATWPFAFTIPILGISTSFFSVLVQSCFVFTVFLVFAPKVNIAVYIFLVMVIILAILGFIELQLIDAPFSDYVYSIEYSFKFMLLPILSWLAFTTLGNRHSLKLFIDVVGGSTCALGLIACFYYLILYDVDYVGRVFGDDGPTRVGKNTLAWGLFCVYVILRAGPKSIGLKSAKYNFQAAFIAIVMILVNARSIWILLLLELVFRWYLAKSDKRLALGSLVVVGGLLFSLADFQDIEDRILKRNKYLEQEVSYSYEEQIERSALRKSWDFGLRTHVDILDRFLVSHRGFLLLDAIKQSVNSFFRPHGLGTFRVRESNLGSRTETHNDYALIIYEWGWIGFLLLLSLVGYMVRLFQVSRNHINKNSIRHVLVYIALFLVSLIFINGMHVVVTPILIGFFLRLSSNLRKDALTC